jgi:hypothetical protein
MDRPADQRLWKRSRGVEVEIGNSTVRRFGPGEFFGAGGGQFPHLLRRDRGQLAEWQAAFYEAYRVREEAENVSLGEFELSTD